MKNASLLGRKGLLALALTLAVGAAGPAALAASGGGSDSGSGSGSSGSGSGSGGGSSADVTVCNKGWVYDKDKKICVKVQSMDDHHLYLEGRALAVAGYYEQALAALEAIRDQNDSMVLTMIGYSKRKLGAVGEGMAYYDRALAIDPDNVNTREYLGEGYVSLGRLDLAEVQLDRIEAVCGQGCEQYQDLAAAMAGHSDW